jgi:hypothetical protein
MTAPFNSRDRGAGKVYSSTRREKETEHMTKLKRIVLVLSLTATIGGTAMGACVASYKRFTAEGTLVCTYAGMYYNACVYECILKGVS